jgi:hypothetical protein
MGIFIEGWNFGRSNTRPSTGDEGTVYVTEPRSETRNVGLRLNFKYIL